MDSRHHRMALLLALALAAPSCTTDQTPDPCAALDCSGHGACAVKDGQASCLCDDGYVNDGLSCILDPCTSSPCIYGTCRPSGKNAICDCYPGYGGPFCDSCAPGYRMEDMACIEGSPCEDNPCLYGLCRSVDGQPVCDCMIGYTGPLCDSCAPGYHAQDLKCLSDSPCDPDPCVHGACSPQDGLATCTCDAGYDGERCDLCATGFHEEGLICVSDVDGPCDPNPCSDANRRICQVDGDTYICLCDPGFHDEAGVCVADPAGPCDSQPCTEANRSVCQVDGDTYICLCDPAFHDDAGVCVPDENNPCLPNPCIEEHRRVCQVDGSSYACLCDPGYHEEGLICVADAGGPCDPNPCTDDNRQSCVADGDGFLCECNPGYHDEAGLCVENTACNPNPCTQAHRTVCMDDGAGGHTCDCVAGYHLDRGACIEDTPCDPNPCSEEHRGVCEIDGEGHICHCDPGYHDEAGDCVQDTTCNAATTCSGHGTCTGVGLECDCADGYTGTHCETCASGYELEGSECVLSLACEPNPCTQPHKTRCVDQGGEPLCLCDEGYRDLEGACVSICDTVVTYEPEAGETITALYIRGEFNAWGLDHPFSRNPDGTYSVTLSLDAGNYAYKLYEQGRDRWFEDSGNPYFQWEGGERNSRLVVRDCDQPVLELMGQPVVSGDSVSFQVRYVDGAQGSGVNPTSAIATSNDETIAGAFDAVTGLFTIDDAGLEPGKYAYRFEASDTAGHKAERLYVPVWVDVAPFAWEDAVLYFAFTDRFNDGDPTNNAPVGGSVDFKADWQGGDFAGIQAKIESGYFDNLGVNAIWISSISQNTSQGEMGTGGDNHFYSGYHSYWPISTGWRDDNRLSGVQPVDPHFGTLEDFKELVRVAHERGMRILVDFVANHVHDDSPLASQSGWFNDLYICGWEQPITCWFAPYLPDFHYERLEALTTMVEHAVWLIQETDIDGFRLDAVKHMIHDFSYALRGRIEEAVTTTGLRFYMVGETFVGEGESEAAVIKDYVRPEELDGQFDFPIYWQVVTTFLREERTFQSLESTLQQFDGYYGDWAVMSNFLGNHDVPRAISHAAGQIGDMWGNGAKEQGWSNPPQAPTDAQPYQRLRLAWTFLMTIPGVPLIYYGDEFGLPGAGDPDNRRFMQFSGLNQNQQDTIAHVRKLTAARKAHRAFRHGRRAQLHMEGDGLIWAYGLSDGADKAVVVINRRGGQETRSIPVSAIGLSNGTTLRDVIHNSTVQVSNNAISITLGGRDSAVLVME